MKGQQLIHSGINYMLIDFFSHAKEAFSGTGADSAVSLGCIEEKYGRFEFEACKRGLDIFLALAGIIASVPVVFVFSFLIKLISVSGPVIYRQNRLGKDGSVFVMYKLRTMRADAEQHTGPVWSQGIRDARLIPLIGSFLRRTHIDELPQLFNVLKGDMSIVGPRPERPEIVQRIAPQINDYYVRLSVRPGITGLAQVRHRYDRTIEDVQKKIDYDIRYIRSMSWQTELQIILETALKMVCGKVIA